MVHDTMRDTDVFGRYGGEEFLIILVDTAPAPALLAVERIRAAVAAHGMGQRSRRDGGLRCRPAMASFRKGENHRAAAATARTWRSTRPRARAATGSWRVRNEPRHHRNQGPRAAHRDRAHRQEERAHAGDVSRDVAGAGRRGGRRAGARDPDPRHARLLHRRQRPQGFSRAPAAFGAGGLVRLHQRAAEGGQAPRRRRRRPGGRRRHDDAAALRPRVRARRTRASRCLSCPSASCPKPPRASCCR